MLAPWTAFEHVADCVVVTDIHGHVKYVNSAFEEFTGFTRDEVIGKPAGILTAGLHETDFYAQLWCTILKGEAFRGVVMNRTKSGARVYEETTISSIKDRAGHPTGFIFISKDVTWRVEAEERLSYLAYHDSLTGLPNRNLFLDRLRQGITHGARNQRTVALLYLDIDQFKAINDNYGHAAGDILLREVTTRLKDCLRGGDTLARLGGDEFAIVLTDLVFVEGVEKVVRSLLQAFVQPFEVLGREAFSSTSVGISLYPKHGADTDELLNCADIAMYHAKEAGGCRYAFFQQNMRETRLIKQAPIHQFAPRPELRDHLQEMHLANRAAGQSESLSRPA